MWLSVVRNAARPISAVQNRQNLFGACQTYRAGARVTAPKNFLKICAILGQFRVGENGSFYSDRAKVTAALNLLKIWQKGPGVGEGAVTLARPP